MNATYNLEHAAEIIVGSGDPAAQEWVRRRLIRGELVGYKAARKWRMTDEHIEENLRRLESRPAIVPNLPNIAGMTKTSQKRMAS